MPPEIRQEDAASTSYSCRKAEPESDYALGANFQLKGITGKMKKHFRTHKYEPTKNTKHSRQMVFFFSTRFKLTKGWRTVLKNRDLRYIYQLNIRCRLCLHSDSSKLDTKKFLRHVGKSDYGLGTRQYQRMT